MKSTFLSFVFLCSLYCAQAQLITPDIIQTNSGPLTIQPVQHASMVLTMNGITVYVDPTGADNYKGMTAPDMILITDIHGDHFDLKTITAVKTAKTILVMPQAVADKIPGADSSHALALDKQHTRVIKNGDNITLSGISIKAIPMYNLPESPTAMHTKGRGNGYVLGLNGQNLYISGDTQGIPEMRSLKDIDIAFICMNLPYTMDVKEAADAVLAFSPKIVYPYHYRGQGGLSDVNAFKTLVDAGNRNIDVRLRNWYAVKQNP